MYVAKTMKPPLVGHAVLGPEACDKLDAFFESGAALGHVDAEDLELLRDEGTAEPGVETPRAQVVQHGQLGCELHGMIERRNDRSRNEPDAPGPDRDRGQKDDRIWRVTAVVEEVVLDRLHRVESELIGALGHAQTLRVVLGRGAVARPEGGEKIDPELHPARLIGACAGGQTIGGKLSRSLAVFKEDRKLITLK